MLLIKVRLCNVTLLLTYFWLFLLVNPYIRSSPPDKIQVQNVGDAVRLNCSAGGSPLPKVTWFKDGRRVVSTAVHDGNDLIKSEFVIHRFQPIDAGMYKCLFFNDKNVTAEANAKLSMYKILNIENTALIFLASARSFNNLLVFIRTLSRNVGVR